MKGEIQTNIVAHIVYDITLRLFSILTMISHNWDKLLSTVEVQGKAHLKC